MMLHCTALAALVSVTQALSTTTLTPPRVTATEQHVLGCVERVQRALDAAADAPQASTRTDPIDCADLATEKGRSRLVDELQTRHHAVVRLDDDGACRKLQEAAFKLLDDPERLQAVGGAAPVSEARPTEFVGVFGGDGPGTFLEVRYGQNNEALPSTVRSELPELGEARRAVGSLGRLLCVATLGLDSAARADDVACDAGGARHEASTTAHRLCGYEATNATVFGAHTDSSFFTLVPFAKAPGLEVLDPSLKAWVCPEEDAPSGAGHLVLVMAGEFLEVASHGRFAAAVHRVRGGPTKRVSTPLLVRADLCEAWDRLSSTSVWRALQKTTSTEARAELQMTGLQRKRYVAPVRTTEEARRFYGALFPGAQVLSASPLIVRLPRFASTAECDALLSLGASMKRSTIVDGGDQNSTAEHRTSRTKWLDDDAVPSSLSSRATAVAELPLINAERWQLASYGEACEYKLHVDTVPAFNDLAPGGRFSTLLLYLDEPEMGGTTDFPGLGLSVAPEKGTALYFRNVCEPCSDPFGLETHEQSAHAGAPVVRGAKNIATRWVHPVPYPDGVA